MEKQLLMGVKHDVRGGRMLREKLTPEPMMMGELIMQPEVGALQPPVEQSTAQVK